MSNFSNQETEFEKFANFSNYFLSNRTNFELKIIEFFELFLPFRINRIVNFRIESNEFRINFHRISRIFFALSNQSNRKFSNRIEQISNEFQFDSTPRRYMCSMMRILQGGKIMLVSL